MAFDRARTDSTAIVGFGEPGWASTKGRLSEELIVREITGPFV